MEYDELIEKIKDALKITKLEIYEKADLQTILKEAQLDGYEAGFEEGEEDGKEISIIELKQLTNGLVCVIIQINLEVWNDFKRFFKFKSKIV